MILRFRTSNVSVFGGKTVISDTILNEKGGKDTEEEVWFILHSMLTFFHSFPECVFCLSELVVLSLSDERKILLTFEMTSGDQIHMQNTNNLEKIQNSQTLPIIRCSQSVRYNKTVFVQDQPFSQSVLKFLVFTKGEYINGSI